MPTPANASDQYKSEIRSIATVGEFKSDGTLVYPMSSSQAVDYNGNGTINTIDTTFDTKSWTMTMVYTSSLLTQLQSTDSITNWTRDITYNADGTIDTDGGWV